MLLKFNSNLIAKGGGSSLVKTIVSSAIISDSVTDEKIGNSYLGTPVMDNMEFPQGAYTDLDDNTIDYGAVVVDTVIFTVNKTRKIIKTSVQGRNGEIKEYISEGDYVITCQGVISNKSNQFPEDQARALRQVFEVPQQLPIVSLFLNNIYDIFNIVIESWSMPFSEGKRNEIPFSFTAVSDVPVGTSELSSS